MVDPLHAAEVMVEAAVVAAHDYGHVAVAVIVRLVAIATRNHDPWARSISTKIHPRPPNRRKWRRKSGKTSLK
jgi:hypothetical protein